MRGGKFLAEESPMSLLLKYNCQSLEDVFLKLSVIQNRGKRRRSSILHDITASIAVPVTKQYIIITQYSLKNDLTTNH